MPQLDVNAFLPIVYCLFLCYSFFFLVIYIFLFLPFINSTKIHVVWQQYRLLSLLILTLHIKEVSSYYYLQHALSLLQSRKYYPSY